MSSMKNLDDTFNFGDQFLYDKPTEDDQEKSKVREESESTIPDPNQTVTSTPPVIAPFTDVSSSKPSLLVTPPPINTEATTITTSLPEITPFIALQLKIGKIKHEMSEVKKLITLQMFLASIDPKFKSRILNCSPGPESSQNQESEDPEGDYHNQKGTRFLFKHMNKDQVCKTEILANYHLYHALNELDSDEDAMDNEVADKVKDHK
ncbi:hypothetical protein Tco_0251184 [Tanacetum coccineum]